MSSRDRSIELKIISATDLKKVKALGQQRSYVVAYIYMDRKITSNVDTEGGVNPTWNFHAKLECPEAMFSHHGTYLNFEIFRQTYFSDVLSDTMVGTVTIPLRDLGKDVMCQVEPEPMSFQVRRPSGRVKGVLNLVIKIGAPYQHEAHDVGLLSPRAPRFTCKRVDQAEDISCDCPICR